MDTTRTPLTDVPNHHAHHPGFAGVTGLPCALGMAVGRSAHADLAIRLVDLRPGDHRRRRRLRAGHGRPPRGARSARGPPASIRRPSCSRVARRLSHGVAP